VVRDSGFFENRTGGAKAGDLTKTNDGYLGVQINPARVSSRPQFNGPLQRFSPDTLCTVAFQRRHAPDCRSAAPEDAHCCFHRLTRNDSQETDRLPIVAIQPISAGTPCSLTKTRMRMANTFLTLPTGLTSNGAPPRIR